MDLPVSIDTVTHDVTAVPQDVKVPPMGVVDETGAVNVAIPDESALIGNSVNTVAPPPPPPPPPVQEENVEEGLVEVREAMKEANEVFNRVKSEKIAEQALCSIRNDQQQYEGLAKEIVGKAIKQKERERANRASAAASRAKVMRYQTELESRLNRVEAERNAFRKELAELKAAGDSGKQLHKLQGWLQKMEAANPDFVRSIIAQDEMDAVLGDKRAFEEAHDDADAKKRRL